jgi:SAM-dependent methyltransferase
MNTENICPVCAQPALRDFLKLDSAPLHVGVVWANKQAATAAPTGSICLSACTCCGFVFNRSFDAVAMDYAPGYEVSLHHSPVYQAFVASTVHKLVGTYGVHDKLVLEVGCGRGYFLRELCQTGGNQGIGVDPSLEADAPALARASGIRYVRAEYNRSWAATAIDCLVCRHVLQHIPNPQAFITEMRETNLQRAEALLYFELPNGSYVFETGAAWNIFYEHCSYISPDLLRRMFVAAGCMVFEHGACFEDGQYMNLVAAVGAGAAQPIAPQAPGEGLAFAALEEFGRKFQARCAADREQLLAYQARDKRIVAWGSGGRGVSFLNSMAGAGQIEYVVDINPERQQRYIPGSAQRIIAPGELANVRPDVIVLTNPTYRDEIQKMVYGMGLTPEYMTA